MINKAQFDLQKCSNCNNCFLQRIGSEYYCNKCEKFNLIFQEEVRVVPSKYESNCRNKRELEHERRLNALIQQFTSKYRDISSPEEMKLFRQRLTSIKDMTPRKKGSREAAAVVIYIGLHEQIKLTIRQFCHHNNLSIKLFNQKYKVYQKLYKNIPIQPQDQDLKLEQKQQEQSPTEKSITEVASLPPCPLEGTKHAIEIIFNDVFNKYIFRTKKGLIVESLLQKIDSVDRELLQQIKYSQNPPLKLYYLIFAVIKSLGHKINFLQFSEIIRNKTGYIIKRKTASQVKKIYQAFANSKSVKEEEDVCESQQGQE